MVPSKGSRTPCPMKNPTRVRHVGDFLSAQEGSCTEDGVLVLQQPGLSPPAHGEGDNHVDLVTYHNPCVHSDSCDPNSNLAPSEPHDEYAAQRRLLFGLGAPAGFEPAPLGLGMVVSNKMCIEPDVLFWLVFNDRTLSYFALASRSARTVVVVYRRTMRLFMWLRGTVAQREDAVRACSSSCAAFAVFARSCRHHRRSPASGSHGR